MASQVGYVAFAEALSAPEVVWSLADAGFQVVAFARRGRRSALRHSRHVRVIEVTPPESDFEATLSELKSQLACSCDASSKPVILPLDDTALWLCSQLASESGCIVAGPSGSQAELALDKWRQVQDAERAGLRVPETFLAQRAEDVLGRRLSFPVVLKSARAMTQRNGRVQRGRHWACADQSELERTRSDWGRAIPLLVQPFIRGTGEGIFGLATPEGIRAWSAHRRLRMMNPAGSGSSACVSKPVSPALKPAIEEFIRRAGWHGLFMIELLRDDQGTEWFVEFNGRTWGSVALSRRQGLEYPAWVVQQALHPDVKGAFPEAAAKSVVCRNAGRELMHLLFVLRGPRSRAYTEWPRFWGSLTDVLKVRGNDSFYNWRRDDKRVFLSDCWRTVCDQVLKPRG